MKFKEYVEQNKISKYVAAAFRSHLKCEDDSDVPEIKLLEEYARFSGREKVEHANPHKPKPGATAPPETRSTAPASETSNTSDDPQKKKR